MKSADIAIRIRTLNPPSLGWENITFTLSEGKEMTFADSGGAAVIVKLVKTKETNEGKRLGGTFVINPK